MSFLNSLKLKESRNCKKILELKNKTITVIAHRITKLL